MKSNYGKNLILLLDEPGLSLHGKAQQDLLRYINEKLKPDYQVIYTSHSPFMIDSRNVFSLRGVEDAVETTKENGHTEEKFLGTKVHKNIITRERDSIVPLHGIFCFVSASLIWRSLNILYERVTGNNSLNTGESRYGNGLTKSVSPERGCTNLKCRRMIERTIPNEPLILNTTIPLDAKNFMVSHIEPTMILKNIWKKVG